MKKRFIAAVLGLMILVCIHQAQAKWWIFGKAEDVPEISSLFIGNIEVVGMSEKMLLLDSSNLQGRSVVVKGFAVKAEAPLAVAKISLDEGQTWEDIEIKDNSFIYQFEPEENREYKPQFKVMDTAGSESDTRDLPLFTLIYKPVDVSKIVEENLRAMIAQYITKNLAGFMQYIADSFIGDQFALEEAIQSDFRRYDNINVDITIQQVIKSGNQAIANFEFEWRGIKKSDGSMVNPLRGKTSYTFQQEGDKYKLLAMASPIIFGISQASEVNSSSLSSVSDATATTFSSQDIYGGSLAVYTATLPSGSGINFATQAVTPGAGDVIFNTGCGAGALDGLTGGAQIYFLSCSGSLSSQTSAPDPSASGWMDEYSFPGTDYLFAVKRSNNTYAIFKITVGDSSCTETSITIQYKYQSDGSRNLP